MILNLAAHDFNVPIVIAQSVGAALLLVFLCTSICIIRGGYVNWRYLLPADLWAINQAAFLIVTVWRKVSGSPVPDVLTINNWSTIVQLQAIITLTGVTVLSLWAYRRQQGGP
jgi:hypothetical protein